jgi:hypothetical protein
VSKLNKTQLVEINLKDLFPADWNYKTDGTPEQIEKLCNSIKEDSSAGVVAVRELGDKFEVIDGNHRLKAAKKLKWKKVPCENFGDISKAKAITIARRRNHKWFDDDIIAYAEIFKDDVLDEYTLDELESFMPDTREEMENLEKLLDFDWGQFESNGEIQEEVKTIKIVVNDDVYENWQSWKTKCQDILGYESESKCFEFAIVEAMNIPDESLH